MAVQLFSAIATKSKDPVFKSRLTVAITEHCRYQLSVAQGGTSASLYAWRQSLARHVLHQLTHDAHVERFARLVLLPAEWSGFDPDSDANLGSRVEATFPMFASDSPPA